MGGEVRYSFIFQKTSSHSEVNIAMKGLTLSDDLEMKRFSVAILQLITCISLIPVGVGMSRMARIYSGLTLIPSLCTV